MRATTFSSCTTGVSLAHAVWSKRSWTSADFRRTVCRCNCAGALRQGGRSAYLWKKVWPNHPAPTGPPHRGRCFLGSSRSYQEERPFRIVSRVENTKTFCPLASAVFSAQVQSAFSWSVVCFVELLAAMEDSLPPGQLIIPTLAKPMVTSNTMCVVAYIPSKRVALFRKRPRSLGWCGRVGVAFFSGGAIPLLLANITESFRQNVLACLAELLIKKGLAFVDDDSLEEIRRKRGSITQPGENSPYRDRSVEENLDLFRR